MRDESLDFERRLDAEDVAAVWPTSPQMAPIPVPEPVAATAADLPSPAPAAPDIPQSVGGLLALAYAALIGALAIATVGSLHSLFAIVIAAAFVAIFFSVPHIFLSIDPGSERRASLDQFLRSGIQTFNGHSTGKDALVQMLIVPALLTLAILAMGVIIAVTF